MKRNELLTSIFDSFDDCANEFCKNSNALICEISAKYGAEDEAEDLKYRYAEVFFKNFKIVFKYSARGLLGTMNSILECMVFLDKSRDAVAIPLPIMADFCGVAAAPLVIPLILNENNMRQAFDCIISALNKMLPRIEETANDYTLKKAALAYYSSELKTVYGSGMEELLVGKTGYKTEDSYRIITNRLLSTAFLRFMKGDTKGAAKKLEKAKYDLFGYEKRMLGLWSSGEKTDMPDISSIRENLRKYNGSGVEKVDMREFWSCFISWFVIGAGAAIVYCALFC